MIRSHSQTWTAATTKSNRPLHQTEVSKMESEQKQNKEDGFSWTGEARGGSSLKTNGTQRVFAAVAASFFFPSGVILHNYGTHNILLEAVVHR